MHRQNQISSGTDARTKTLESGSERAPPVTAGVTITQAGSVMQASNVYHTATLYSEERLAHAPQNVNSMSYASAVASQPASNAQQKAQNSNNAQCNDGAISEQEDGGDDATTGKKKKRKRGRRRKRKGL